MRIYAQCERKRKRERDLEIAQVKHIYVYKRQDSHTILPEILKG